MTKTTKPDASETETKPKAKARSGGSGPWGEVQLIEASGQTFAEATQIEATSAWTVVSVLAKDGQPAVGEKPAEVPQQGVILPVGAASGDLVEMYFDGYIGRVFVPEGETFTFTDDRIFVDVGSSAMFRKLTDTVWRYVAGA